LRAGLAPEAQSRLIVMGAVCAAYGVRGALKVRTFTAAPEGLLAYAAWWLRAKAEWREFAVLESRRHGETIVASLRGLENREAALKWRGAEVAVPRAALPPLSPGEVYLDDVLGSIVVNRQGATLGRVAGFIETGVHPVLRVADDATGAERLIPMVPAFVDSVDVAAARVVVDWPSDI
jgi:16S rRNA processing protein RimM